MRFLALLLASLATVLSSMASPNAFPPTAPEVSEFKTLPAGLLLKSTGRGSYFEESNRLFGPLFNYISRRDIAMTTPVEAQIDQAAMFFWVAPGEQSKVAGSEGGVEVVKVGERRVASRGAEGSYSRRNFEATRDALIAWLAQQPGVVADGEPYAVYWHGPFTPWFAKRSEVHIPVRSVEPRQP